MKHNLWKDVDIELPPCDGIYEITNDVFLSMNNKKYDLECLDYDGYGFKFLGIYRPVKYWRFCLPLEKKYGKVTEREEKETS